MRVCKDQTITSSTKVKPPSVGWFFNSMALTGFVERICGTSLVTIQTFNDQKKASEEAHVLHGSLTGRLSEQEIRYVLRKGVTSFNEAMLRKISRIELLTDLNAAGHGIYLMLNEGNGRGRSAKNVIRVRAVFVDLDGAPLEPVLECELKPHIVIETSPGRYHVIWLVDGMPLEQFCAVQTVLAEKFNGDKSNKDLSRVVRIPGLWHRKREVPSLVRMIEHNEHRPFKAVEFLKALEIDPERVKTSKSVSQAPLTRNVIPIGHRNNSLASLAGAMRRKGMSEQAINAALQSANERCEPPLEPQEVADIAKSISKYKPAPDEFKCTDLGNAERLVYYYGQDLRYCRELGWLFWDSMRWVQDKTGEVDRRAKETVRSIYAEAATATDDDKRKGLADFARKCESRQRIEAMVKLAETEKRIIVRPEDFDKNPFLLNCMNGTLDVRTCEIKEHNRSDFITKLIAVEYDPHAKCPQWRKFLTEIFDENKKLIRYVQKALGYCLTGETSEHIWFFLYGMGANGKSTLINTILYVLGEYGCQTPPDTFLAHKGDGARNDLARLQGVRFIAASEPDGAKRLDDGIVKMFTGGDPITARFLYKEFLTYVPEGKLFLSANHKPRVTDNSRGFWRRVAMLPFVVTIPEEEQDKGLMKKLRAEAPGILAWMVRGCFAWQKKGLGKPEAVKEAAAEYQEEMNPVADFLKHRSLVTGPNKRVRKKDLYDHYKDEEVASGGKPISNVAFSRILQGRFKTVRMGARKISYWVGIGIKSPFDRNE